MFSWFLHDPDCLSEASFSSCLFFLWQAQVQEDIPEVRLAAGTGPPPFALCLPISPSYFTPSTFCLYSFHFLPSASPDLRK